MKLNKKGFTLIELLAVIVILAVIALIAVPQVIQILNKARKSAAEDSAYGIIKAAESYVATYMMDHQGEWVSEDITFTCTDGTCTADKEITPKTLDFKGTKPSSGAIKLGVDGEATISTDLKINGFTCKENSGKIVCE